MQGMQFAIAEALQKQFTHISAAMHDYLRQANDPMPAAAQATVVRVLTQSGQSCEVLNFATFCSTRRIHSRSEVSRQALMLYMHSG